MSGNILGDGLRVSDDCHREKEGETLIMSSYLSGANKGLAETAYPHPPDCAS